MNHDTSESDARLVFDYLRANDPLPTLPVDAVFGFGHFDLRVPQRCGELFSAGLARWIIFTGGVGAGTADLGQPEADAFREELLRVFPSIPSTQVIAENRSTNTGDNIRFTAALLAARQPELTFGRGLRSAILVANAYRLRRVRLTWRKLQPDVNIAAIAPATDFATECALFAAKSQSLVPQLVGEIDRLLDYPSRDWIEAEPIPPAVLAAHARLKAV